MHYLLCNPCFLFVEHAALLVPIISGVALGGMRWWLMSRFSYFNGNRRNPPLFHDRIPALPTLLFYLELSCSHWRTPSGNKKSAGVNTERPSREKRTGKRLIQSHENFGFVNYISTFVIGADASNIYFLLCIFSFYLKIFVSPLAKCFRIFADFLEPSC